MRMNVHWFIWTSTNKQNDSSDQQRSIWICCMHFTRPDSMSLLHTNCVRSLTVFEHLFQWWKFICWWSLFLNQKFRDVINSLFLKIMAEFQAVSVSGDCKFRFEFLSTGNVESFCYKFSFSYRSRKTLRIFPILPRSFHHRLRRHFSDFPLPPKTFLRYFPWIRPSILLN